MTFALIFIGLFVLITLYYLVKVAKKPTLLFQDTPLNNAIINATPILSKRYCPTPWLFNTHLQLIIL